MEPTNDETDTWARAAVATLLWWCLREADFELARWELQLRGER